MPTAGRFQKILSSLLLFMIPLLVVWLVAEPYYSSSKVRYGVIDEAERAELIFAYLRFTTSFESLDFLTEKEYIHMQDVRNVIVSMGVCVVLLLVMISITSLQRRGGLSVPQLRLSYLVWLNVLFGLVIFFFWRPFFVLLHELMFWFNDYWLLPADSVLIQLFPEVFFRELVVVYIVVLNLCLLAVASRADSEK